MLKTETLIEIKYASNEKDETGNVELKNNQLLIVDVNINDLKLKDGEEVISHSTHQRSTIVLYDGTVRTNIRESEKLKWGSNTKVIVLKNITVKTNYTTIDYNFGTVTYNDPIPTDAFWFGPTSIPNQAEFPPRGTILINKGVVTDNYGYIDLNEGTIKDAHGDIAAKKARGATEDDRNGRVAVYGLTLALLGNGDFSGTNIYINNGIIENNYCFVHENALGGTIEETRGGTRHGEDAFWGGTFENKGNHYAVTAGTASPGYGWVQFNDWNTGGTNFGPFINNSRY